MDQDKRVAVEQAEQIIEEAQKGWVSALELGWEPEDGGKTPIDWTGAPMYYRLDENHNVLPATRDQMVEMFNEPGRRRVAQDFIETRAGTVSVSTVFLVLDHNHLRFTAGGPPIVFETMIFGGDPNEDHYWAGGENCWRYATWDEAVAGHRAVVEAITNNTPLP